MVVGLELLVKDADAVPELGVFDVFKTVKSVLVCIKGLVDVFRKQIAMAEGCPTGAVFRVKCCHLLVVGDGSLIVALGTTEFRKLRNIVKGHEDL